MIYFIIKTLLTSLVIVSVAELSRRYTIWAAVLVSLPLTSILAFIWLYIDTKDTGKIIELSYSVFWLVIPSLAFFMILPFFLKHGFNFVSAMAISMLLMAAIYTGGVWVLKVLT